MQICEVLTSQSTLQNMKQNVAKLGTYKTAYINEALVYIIVHRVELSQSQHPHCYNPPSDKA